jgi:hypothetical protein
LERETGFEPATSYLEGRHSATELLPLAVTGVNFLFYTLFYPTVNVCYFSRLAITSLPWDASLQPSMMLLGFGD